MEDEYRIKNETRDGDENKGIRDTKDHKTVENPENSSQEGMERKWANIKEDYKKQYPDLPDKLYEYLPGQFDKMLDHIASNTKRCRAEVHNEILHWNVARNE